MKRNGRIGIVAAILIVIIIVMLGIWFGLERMTEQPVQTEEVISEEIQEESEEASIIETESESIEEKESEQGTESESESEPESEEATELGFEPEEILTVPLAEAVKWDQVVYGSYEQDNDLTNGAEPIVWYVLDIKEGKAFLLSSKVLDAMPYHEALEAITWENCTLRKWLNEEFYTVAFTEEDKEGICATTLENMDNLHDGTEGGNDTVDNVFLLSQDDMMTYLEFGLNEDQHFACEWKEEWLQDVNGNYEILGKMSRAVLTRYAYENGADNFYSELSNVYYANWYLRSPGYAEVLASDVSCFGGTSFYGLEVNVADIGVRPAIWVEIPQDTTE